MEPTPREVGPDGRVRLTPEQERFLDWLCGEREPGQSQNAFAEVLGCHANTLCKWKKEAGFLRAWDERMRATAAHPEKLTALLEKQYDKAMDGDTKAFEAYLKAVGQMAPNRLVIHDERREASEMTDAELEERLRAHFDRQQGDHLEAAVTQGDHLRVVDGGG